MMMIHDDDSKQEIVMTFEESFNDAVINDALRKLFSCQLLVK